MTEAFRPLLAILLSLSAGSAAVVATATPAHACSCVALTDAQALAPADAVFTGRLLGRQDNPRAADGTTTSGDPATLSFDVARVFKGEVAARQPVRSGASCGWALSGEGPFLVFANRDGAALTTGLCSGNRAGAAPAGWGPGSPPHLPVAGPAATSANGFWDVGAQGAAIAAVLVLLAGLLNLPRSPREE